MQALPYFREYAGKTVVVKYGGNAMLSEELKTAVMEDVVLLNTVGIRVVLVHGGGPEINATLEKIGKESTFVNGLRYTDAETMEVVQMVLSGKLNKDIVGILLQQGGRAVGLSGVDGGLLRAKKRDKDGVDLGLVGEVTGVNAGIVETLLDRGFIPVISTVALGEDGDTNRYNINADTAAAQIASALRAEKFVQLTNVPGVLRDVRDPDTLIKQIAREAVPSMIATGVISSGMIPKVECCLEALKGGVPRAHIIDGRMKHSLLVEMFSDRGIGVGQRHGYALKSCTALIADSTV
nr:acetylglutamate kinase [Treponema endosymbiont of Eucomonympha sp.]